MVLSVRRAVSMGVNGGNCDPVTFRRSEEMIVKQSSCVRKAWEWRHLLIGRLIIPPPLFDI